MGARGRHDLTRCTPPRPLSTSHHLLEAQNSRMWQGGGAFLCVLFSQMAQANYSHCVAPYTSVDSFQTVGKQMITSVSEPCESFSLTGSGRTICVVSEKFATSRVQNFEATAEGGVSPACGSPGRGWGAESKRLCWAGLTQPSAHLDLVVSPSLD